METNWRTVRVFISSTFRDMQAERDWLVKVVFQELRERMAKRNLYLVDVDLRWGVTEEEAEHGKALEICLDEIEHCRPFFIGILGERYGYVPPKVPEDAEFTYPWLAKYKGHSLTALEIIHGVLRDPDLAQRAFFYFRDPQVIAQIAESQRSDYLTESPEAAKKLSDLKDKIKASKRPVMEGYTCRWDNKQGRIIDLDAFGQRVLEDLWSAIDAAYPKEALAVDPLTVERQMHESFADERSRLHVGREEQAKQLTKYVQGEDRRPAVITGESGCGKSAFLANWCRQYTANHSDDFVLAYFIGASPDSTNHLRLLRNMCSELKQKFSLKEEIPEDDKKLSETLAVMLASASKNKERIIIALDALDQLLPLEAAHGLEWLLDYMPEKARLVVSTLEGDCLDALRRRKAEEIALPSLTAAEQRQIVTTLLGEWRRKLDGKQTAALLAHPGVKNPLYLRVALEELKLFGKFEQLTDRIKALAEDIPGLFNQMLERLEADHGRELVSEAFSLIGCSRYGLSETELLQLLRREGEEQFPRVLWARLYRISKMYLVQRGELISFFHRQLAETAAARYPEHKKTYTKLAAYFEKAAIERKLDEYPYQLQHAEEWEVLAKALSDLDFFEYAWDHDRKYEWMGYWRSLEGHFEPGKCYQAAIEAREKLKGETRSIATLLGKVGWFLDDMGLYPSALPFKERALAMDEQTLGPKHPDMAHSINNLALLYHNQGKYDEALPLYQRALAISEKALGPNHPVVAHGLDNLASLYRNQGKYDKALPLCQRALAIRESVRGPDHPDVATSLNNLAALYGNQSKYDEALPLLQRALTIWEHTLGPNHPNIAASLNNLAVLYDDQGKRNEALPLYQRALEITEGNIGPNHPDVATSLNNLAVLYCEQNRYDEALPLYQRTLVIREKALGPNHPDVAQTLNDLAILYGNQNKYDEALPLLQRALTITEKTLGSNHPDVAAILNGMGDLYRNQGKYKEAQPLYERALVIREKALGANHPDVSKSLKSLALFYYNQGKYKEAQPLYQRALAIREKALGPDHPDVASILNDLADLYTNQGKYKEALTLYQRALAIRERYSGPNHPDVATILNDMADLYSAQDKADKALPLLQRALEISEQAYGPDHPDVAIFLNSMAGLYYNQDKYDKALPLFQRALAIRERNSGPDHADVAEVLNNMAMLLHAQHKYKESQTLYQRALAIRERALDPDHPQLLDSLFNLGLLYGAQNKFKEALPLFKRALKIAEATLGKDNPKTKQCREYVKACENR